MERDRADCASQRRRRTKKVRGRIGKDREGE